MADDPKATNGANEPGGAKEPPQDEKVILSKEEFDKRLQAEADKRVTSALKTAQAKWKEEYEARVKAEREDAEKLARMNEEERARALEKKREEQLIARERTLHQKEMEIQAIKVMDERSLPVAFARTLIGESAEATLENINSFEKAWHQALEKEVADRMKGKVPPADEGKEKSFNMNDIIRGQARRRR